jgi:hypothetical protein
MVMRNEFLDEIADTLFAVAVAGAIGLGAANLAIQVNKERAASDADTASQKLSHFAYPPRSLDTQITDFDKTMPTRLNF